MLSLKSIGIKTHFYHMFPNVIKQYLLVVDNILRVFLIEAFNFVY